MGKSTYAELDPQISVAIKHCGQNPGETGWTECMTGLCVCTLLLCFTIFVCANSVIKNSTHHLAQIKPVFAWSFFSISSRFARSHWGLVVSNRKEKQDVLPSTQYTVPPWHRADKTKAKASHDCGKCLLLLIFFKHPPKQNVERPITVTEEFYTAFYFVRQHSGGQGSISSIPNFWCMSAALFPSSHCKQKHST